VATRKPNSPFAPAHLLPCSNPWLQWCLSANCLRAYAGTDIGVVLSARLSPAHPFGHSVVWAEANQMGTVDGPMWVAPQEDVIFYCSAGPGKATGTARQLWMWRKGKQR
jgi:hypothetical protein